MNLKLELLNPPLNLKDLNMLISLEKEAFGQGGLGEFEIPAFALFGAIYLFFVNDELAGHAIVVRYFEKDAAFLYSFALKKEFRGKRLSQKFLEMVLSEIKKKFNVVYLTVKPDNEPALRIYKKAGFYPVELIKDFYGKGEDRYLMILVFNGREAL